MSPLATALYLSAMILWVCHAGLRDYSYRRTMGGALAIATVTVCIVLRS